MTGAAARLVAGAVVVFAACSVSLRDPVGRACDEGHPCAGGRVCAGGFCTASSALDAGVADAAASESGVADSGDGTGTPNLHPDGTFESGCGRWQTVNGTETASGDAHTGSGSCRICSTGPGGFSFDDKGFLASPPPGRYQASAWIRPAPGEPAPRSWGILLRTVDEPTGPSFAEVEKSASNPAVTTDWAELTVALDVTKPADVLNVVVYTDSSMCLLVDDVRAERVP